MDIKVEFQKAFDERYENIPEGEVMITPSMDIALWAAKWMAERISTFMIEDMSCPSVNIPVRRLISDEIRQLAKSLGEKIE